ncbi:MAG: right-handed parallel beta-helix repeat-containing protein [Syntrophaceae bacterium]|nr:right-handed parallel beta-helix repeat-containing protein [Syntrophaceae bacterium]
MRKKQVRLTMFMVLVGILFTFGLSYAQTPPTLLVVVRASDDSLWKMICDETACSSFSSFPGLFRYQPTVTWDETAQEWVLVGTASNNTIWMSTFDKNGNFNNDWAPLPGLTPSPAGASAGTPRGVTRTVNCPTQSLQAEINAANPGDVINVTGTCNENITFLHEKQRITIDGGNVATINGPSSSNSTVMVRGANGIVIQNFTITGGARGIQLWRGASATINHNTIQSTGGQGIVVGSSSHGVIKNNTIQNNPGTGIMVEENSQVRIGFDTTSDSTSSPNTIQNNGQNNGGRGILVWKGSTAWIVGNTIASNGSDGIGVMRLSEATISSNTINANAGSGIYVSHNSGITLGEDNPTNFLGYPNYTTSNNTEYGIRCSMGAYVRGHLGSSNQINGNSGQQTISSNCPQDLTTP